MVDIDRGMFFQTVMRLIVFRNPVRVQIAVEFKRLAVFIKFAFRRIMLISCRDRNRYGTIFGVTNIYTVIEVGRRQRLGWKFPRYNGSVKRY